MPRSVSARVAAVFCAGMYDYDANFVYAPLADVQRLLEQHRPAAGERVAARQHQHQRVLAQEGGLQA